MVPRDGGSSDTLSHSSHSVVLRAYILMPHWAPKRRRQRPPVVMSHLLLLQGASGHLLSPWDLLSSWKHLGPPNFTDTIKQARGKIVYSPRSSSPQQPLYLASSDLLSLQAMACLGLRIWWLLLPFWSPICDSHFLPGLQGSWSVAWFSPSPLILPFPLSSHLHPLLPPSKPCLSWGVLSSQELCASVGHSNKSIQYTFGDEKIEGRVAKLYSFV